MIDEFWAGGPRFYKNSDAFPIGTDAVLLSHFASLNGAKRVCDIGCGSGVIGILMALLKKDICVDGIEISKPAALAAENNVHLNGLDDRVNIICADINDYRGSDVAGVYDLVVSNPPYYAQNAGSEAFGSAANMRGEITMTMENVVSAASYLVRYGGKFAIVHKPERMCELMCMMSRFGLEPKRLRMVQNTPESAPSLVLIEGRRGGKPGITIDAPLYMTAPDGGESMEVQEIYHRRQEK